MGWFKTGFESAKTAYDYDDGPRGPRRFWMPPESEKRIIFLDENPVTFWEHTFKFNGSWQNHEPCKIRNRMDNVCEICKRYPDRKPSYIGMLSVISMTPWESKNGREFCFGRELYVAKLGGKDKPGMLKKMERIKKQQGGLTGCIFDVYRSGGKTESVGDEYTFVEKIDSKKIESYGKKMLKGWAEEVNEKIEDPENYLTLDKLWERAPWTPFDYGEILEVRSNEELQEFLGTERAEADGGSTQLDEDVPY